MVWTATSRRMYQTLAWPQPCINAQTFVPQSMLQFRMSFVDVLFSIRWKTETKCAVLSGNSSTNICLLGSIDGQMYINLELLHLTESSHVC